MTAARHGRLSFAQIRASHPVIDAVLADLRPGQLREIQASRPGATAAELCADLHALPLINRDHGLWLISEDDAPRALVIAVMGEHRRIALAMVATRAWEGGMPPGVYRWCKRIFLPMLDRTHITAALVEVIRFPDTPPRAHDWLRRLGFTVARTQHLHEARADRITFRWLAPDLRSTPARKAS